MSLDADWLYGLLPAIYRQRDAGLAVDGGPGPLRELIEIIAGQLSLVDAEIDRLYDDAFIETCAPWVVPYIGDLVGSPARSGAASALLSPRAEVANTIRYRRWKGTATILEQLASDVTGWSAVAVEFFRLLSTTQFVNHLRLDSLGTADIRHAAIASSAGTPFDRNTHHAEVRRIRSARGRYNISNIGVYVWRLVASANPDNPSQAARVADGHYTFDPLGADRPLVQLPAAKRDPFSRTMPGDVPAPLSIRAALALTVYPFSVCDAGGMRIADAHVAICDLSGWDTAAGTPVLPAPFVVGVDPRLGRIWFPPGFVAAGSVILVTGATAFSGAYGAGFYARPFDDPASVFVTRDPVSLGPALGLAGAVQTALTVTARPVIGYADNVTDDTATNLLTLSAGQSIVVRGEDRRRPVFTGGIEVQATLGAGGSAILVLDGLLCGGGITVAGDGAFSLVLRNCTVGAGAGGLAISWAGPSGALTAERSLLGGVSLQQSDVDAVISDCTVDAAGGLALVAGRVTLLRSTVFGGVDVREVGLIENAIVTGAAVSQRSQAGCVRYSWLPSGSTLPQRYRCQPDTAALAAVEAEALANPLATQAELDAVARQVSLQVVPQFTAEDRGAPGYAQLSARCPKEVAAGADDGGEMGVFHDIYASLREADLLSRLEDNIRIGLDAGVLHASS